MQLVRIGDKVVSKDKIYAVVDKILELRSLGRSQQEVADQLRIDRTLVSRLESLGEVRKGGRIALIGFPIENTAELRAMAEAEGVDFTLVMNDVERWQYVEDKSGVELLNRIMDLITQARSFDAVIFLGSDMRLRLAEAILGEKCISIEIGSSPIQKDKYVDPEMLRDVIRSLRV